MNSSHAAASEMEVGAHCRSASDDDLSSFSTSIIVDACASPATLGARWVTLRARWVTLRARWDA
jgi:hypothetical protein